MAMVFEVYVKFYHSRDEIFLKQAKFFHEACDFVEKFLDFIWLNSSLDLIRYVKIVPIEVDEG